MNNTMSYPPTPQEADDTLMNDVLSSMVPDDFGNYIGPGWSDGKMQDSVAWGDSDPRSELDLLAYYHDSAYAKFKDERHRMEADRIFAEKASKIPGGLAAISKVAVVHGNMVMNAGERTQSNVSIGTALWGPVGALAGLLYTGVQNIVKANDMLPGGANEKARKEVLKYYDTDPHKRQNMTFDKPKPVNTPVKEETKTPSAPKAPKQTEEEAEALRKRSVQSREEMRKEAERMEKIWAAAREKRDNKSPAAKPKPSSVGAADNPKEPNPLEKVNIHHVSTYTEPPKDSEVRVNDPRSLFSRLFKRKKKKKKTLVPIETEDQRARRLVDAQTAINRHRKELRDAAERSTLRTSQKVFVNKHGQSLAALDHGARVRRAYSNKRITQYSEVGGVKQQ